MISRRLFNAARVSSNFLFGRNLYGRSAIVRAIYDTAQTLHMRINPAHREWKRFMLAQPMAPWFVPDAVHFLESLLTRDLKVFEWGSGRSTVWLAMHGAHVTSVETDRHWFEDVSREVDQRGLQSLVDLHLTDATGKDYADIIRSCGGPFDLVIVDGIDRVDCLAAVSAFVKSDGVIVVDNADRADLIPALASWTSRLIRSFDNGVNRTSFYGATAKPEFRS